MLKNKVEFVYSWIYDEMRRESQMIQEKLKTIGQSYPSPKKIIGLMNIYNKKWAKEEKTILQKLTKISGLKWKDEIIKCYIIGYGKSFSDPLTISLFNRNNQFIDVLIHELIHVLLIQNYSRTRKWFIYVYDTFKGESKTTINHILLHALYWRLLNEIYGPNRLKKVINREKQSPDYKRSWEIVNEIGADKIIKTFRELTE